MLELLDTFTVDGAWRFDAASVYKYDFEIARLPVGYLDEKECFGAFCNTAVEYFVPRRRIAAWRLTAPASDADIVTELERLELSILGNLWYAYRAQAADRSLVNPTEPGCFTTCHVRVGKQILRPYWHIRKDGPYPKGGWCYGAGATSRDRAPPGWCIAKPGLSMEHWKTNTVLLTRI
jgi:hypothetical protein